MAVLLKPDGVCSRHDANTFSALLFVTLSTVSVIIDSGWRKTPASNAPISQVKIEKLRPVASPKCYLSFFSTRYITSNGFKNTLLACLHHHPLTSFPLPLPKHQPLYWIWFPPFQIGSTFHASGNLIASRARKNPQERQKSWLGALAADETRKGLHNLGEQIAGLYLNISKCANIHRNKRMYRAKDEN